MLWTLADLTFTCAWRRIGATPRRRRAVASAALAAWALAPVLAFLGGRRVGEALTIAFTTPGAAEAFALSLGLTGALIGAVVVSLAPGRSVLGAQLVVAPVALRTEFVGLTLVPIAALGVVAGPPVVAFVVALTAEAPGGASAAVSALAALAAAASGGAAAVAAALGIARRSQRSASASAVLLAAWAATSAAADGATAGPLGFFVRDLAAANASTAACAAPLALLAVVSAAAWGVAATAPDEGHAARRRTRAFLRVPAAAAAAVFVVALKRYGRRRELRRHTVAVVALAAGGGLLLRALLRTPAEATLALATGIAAFGAAVVPLAALGLDRECEWFWRTCPRRRSAIGAAGAAAALAAGAAVVVAAVAPVLAAAPVPAAQAARLGPPVLLTLACGLVAGAAVPWRSDRLADQLASYGALVVAITLASLGAGRAVSAAGGWGVPEATASNLAVCLFGVLGVAVSAAAGARRATC